jgi:ribonuclease P protein component
MLPKRNRLKKQKDISTVFRRGHFAKHGIIFAKYFFSEEKETKIAFSAPVKIFKKATERSKAKRILREASRQVVKNAKPGLNIIVWPGEKIDKDIPFSQIESDIENLFKNNKLVN